MPAKGTTPEDRHATRMQRMMVASVRRETLEKLERLRAARGVSMDEYLRGLLKHAERLGL